MSVRFSSILFSCLFPLLICSCTNSEKSPEPLAASPDANWVAEEKVRKEKYARGWEKESPSDAEKGFFDVLGISPGISFVAFKKIVEEKGLKDNLVLTKAFWDDEVTTISFIHTRRNRIYKLNKIPFANSTWTFFFSFVFEDDVYRLAKIQGSRREPPIIEGTKKNVFFENLVEFLKDKYGKWHHEKKGDWGGNPSDGYFWFDNRVAGLGAVPATKDEPAHTLSMQVEKIFYDKESGNTILIMFAISHSELEKCFHSYEKHSPIGPRRRDYADLPSGHDGDEDLVIKNVNTAGTTRE